MTLTYQDFKEFNEESLAGGISFPRSVYWFKMIHDLSEEELQNILKKS